MTFSEKLADYQKRLDLSQAELAALLDIPPRTLWTWLQGEDRPKRYAVTEEGALARLERAAEKWEQRRAWDFASEYLDALKRRGDTKILSLSADNEKAFPDCGTETSPGWRVIEKEVVRIENGFHCKLTLFNDPLMP